MYGNHYLLKRLCYICFDLKCYIWFMAVGAIVTAGVGITQAVLGSQAEARARKERKLAAQKMQAASSKKLELATKLDNEWTSTFGDATSKAAAYYSELTGESLRQQYELTGNQAQMQNYQNFQNQLKQLDTKINQMGMQNSSQALSALMQMSTQQMANNAAINFETQMNKMKSDQEVAQQQAAWSQQGNFLKQMAIDTRNQGYNMQFQAAQVEAGFAQSDMQSAQQQQAAGMQNIMSGIQMASSGWDSYQGRKTYSTEQSANRQAITDAYSAATARQQQLAAEGQNQRQQLGSNFALNPTVGPVAQPSNTSLLNLGNTSTYNYTSPSSITTGSYTIPNLARLSYK